MKAIKNILSKGNTNTKTAKNSLTTFILYLAPHTQNDKKVNLCPFASKGCIMSCLYTAGMGKFSNVQKARIAKSNFLVNNRKDFYMQLAKEIQNKVKYYQRKGEKIAFRLNGTSDVDHIKALKTYANLDIETLKGKAVFYDYTANLKMAIKYKSANNYFVTFSRKEDNESQVLEALKQGINVSAVFKNELPRTYKNYTVIDGDKSDIIMLYNKGVILGLRAKGDAKKDTSGFVINNQ